MQTTGIIESESELVIQVVVYHPHTRSEFWNDEDF